MTAPQQQPVGAAVPLSAPYYGASIGVAFARFWKKYATFIGRASRSEYWWWYLISIIVSAVFGGLAGALGGYGYQTDGTMAAPSAGAVIVYVLWGIWGLATIIPHLALTVRRLHDTDHRGWWIFITLVPLVGTIILIVLLILPSQASGERFDRAGA